MFNTPRCHRRLGLPITLALILTSGHAIAADAAPWAGGDVASKLADVEAEVGLLRKAGPAQFPAAARYADELEKEWRSKGI